MKALRDALRMPGFIGLLWLLSLLSAAGIGLVLRAAAASSLDDAAPPAEHHALFSLLELLLGDRSLATLGIALPTMTAVAGLAVWTSISPALILRLQGVRAPAELGYGWAKSLGAVWVQTLWHLLLRALLLVVLWASVGALGPPWNLLLVAAALMLSSVALDLARVGVVRHGASPYHPATAAYAFVRALQHPRTLLVVGAAWLLQVFSAAAILYAAMVAVGPGSMIWPMRFVALLAVVAGLWRLALAVRLGPVPLRSVGSTSGSGVD